MKADDAKPNHDQLLEKVRILVDCGQLKITDKSLLSDPDRLQDLLIRIHYEWDTEMLSLNGANYQNLNEST